MNSGIRIGLTALTIAITGSTFAAVSAEEAKVLGTILTPWGAEKAGNKEGTIPEYKDERVQPPPSYNPKEPGQLPDPWTDKPLYSITAQNVAKYAANLTEGHLEMFKKYPNFRMDVYPSRRTAQYAKYVVENTLKNATSCKATKEELRLEGCYGGIPFPIPKTGAEVMWNHLGAFQARAWAGISTAWVVTSTGTPVFMSSQYAFQSAPFFEPTNTKPAEGKDIYWRIRLDYTGPARRVGEKLVVIDPLDQFNYTRRAYSYIPGQRRVKLAPDLAYDTPSPTAGGVGVMDEGKGFLGALDRFNWTLKGKKEKFIMYNNFDLADGKTGCTDEFMLSNKNFPKPECIRWELHRVWVVEAKLKPGYRHVYHRRMYYWDEDTFQGGHVANFDAAGQLFRMTNQIVVPMYEAVGTAGDGSIFMDFQTGQVALQGGMGMKEPGYGWSLVTDKGDGYYSPETLAAEGIR